MGKVKYVPQASNMTQQEYDALCHDVWALRNRFLQTWVKDEYTRRNATFKPHDTSFQEWYEKVVALVPTPRLIKRSSLKSCKKKRRIEVLDEITLPIQQNIEKEQVKKMAKILPCEVQNLEHECLRGTSRIEMLEPEDIMLLDPAEPISELAFDNKRLAFPTAYCGESLSIEDLDWLTTTDRGHVFAQWTNSPGGNYTGEALAKVNEDQVQVSMHLSDTEPTDLSMIRRSSELIIDFGAPSCWYVGDEPKHTPFFDVSQWADSDLTEALATEPSIFNWDDSVHILNSPAIEFP